MTTSAVRQIKELESLEKRLQTQIRGTMAKKQRLNEDHEKVLENNQDSRNGFDDFFSLEKKSSNVEKKQKKTLIELIVNGEYNFYISQFFYDMLFKHQTEALQWLLSQHVMRKGSILADEMGLGKTISAISLMSTLYTTHWETLSEHESFGGG